MNVETRVFSNSNDFNNVCTKLRQVNKKSNHIEMKNEDGIYPTVAEGKCEMNLSLVDDTLRFLERNARCSNNHKDIALRTISYLRGLYSTKNEVKGKLDEAINRIEKIKTAQIKLEDIRKDKSTCDLTLYCANNERVTEHLSSLIQLPFFNTLSQEWKKQFIEKKSFDFRQFPKAAVETILDHIYGHALPDNISLKDLIWVYALADFLDLNSMKEFAKEAFRKELRSNPDTLVDALMISITEVIEKDPENFQPSPIEAFHPVLEKCYGTPLDSVTKSRIQKVIPDFQALAERNDPFAQTFLGFCYDRGIGVKKDKRQAIELFTKASEQGSPTAQTQLGSYYEDGTGVGRNLKKASELFLKAAEQGFDVAEVQLGYYYEEGIGVEQDSRRAIELYTKAFEQGNLDAQACLGFCYQRGVGVDQDLKKAIELYTKAIEQGNANAQYFLGACYEEGIGVEQDVKKAIELYTQAREQRNPMAKNRLDQMGWEDYFSRF